MRPLGAPFIVWALLHLGSRSGYGERSSTNTRCLSSAVWRTEWFLDYPPERYRPRRSVTIRAFVVAGGIQAGTTIPHFSRCV